MCFFVAQFAKASRIRTRYWNSVLRTPENFGEHFVAYGFDHPQLLVVRNAPLPEAHVAQWGLVPSWVASADDARAIANRTLNARAETMLEKPSFRGAARQGRCIVPVNGFYEYQHSGSRKTPYFISPTNGDLFSLGALYTEWTNPQNGALLRSFSIVTTPANPLLEVIHNSKKRMPLIIPPDRELDWLDSRLPDEEIKGLLRPFTDASMQAWEVAPLIRNGTVPNSPLATSRVSM